MIRFYKSLNTISLFFIPAFVIALWLQGFTKPNFVVESTDGLLYGIVSSFLALLPRFLQVLLAMALVSYQAIYLNLLFNKHEVLYKNTYLPSLFYVLVMSFSSDITMFHPILLVNLILLAVMDKIFTLFKSANPVSQIFDSCFLISLCSLIYFPSVVMFAIFFFALIALRSFSLRELLVAFTAFLLPYFFLVVYAFVTDSPDAFTNTFLVQFSFVNPDIDFSAEKILLVPAFYLAMLLVFSLLKLRANYYKNAIRTRSALQIILAYFILAIAAFVLAKPFSISHFTLAAVPASGFLAYFYLAVKKRMWLVELSFWVLVAMVVWNNYLQ
jgi:hypothetical protein